MKTKKAISQADISRRFHIEFRYTKDGATGAYDCSYTDKSEKMRGASTPTDALIEFHRYMQRACGLWLEDYCITAIWDTYADAQGSKIRRDYAVPLGPNPNVKIVREYSREVDVAPPASVENRHAPWIEEWLNRKAGKTAT